MKSISVLYDIREILFQGRGWERFGVNLLKEMILRPGLVFYFVVENVEKAKSHYPFLDNSSFNFIEEPIDRSCHFKLQDLPKNGEVDIYHCLTEYPEFRPLHAKLIVSLHDFTVFKYPQEFKAEFKNMANENANYVFTHANQVIVFSQAVAKDIDWVRKKIVHGDFKAPSVAIIPHGLDHFKKTCKGSFERPFFLVVGGFESDKNIDLVLNVYSEEEKINKTYDLYLVGPNPEKLKSSPHSGIKVFKSISDTELATLYASAEALICPSFDEGFGFTPLEARALGCSVLVSDISVFRETLGDQAEYFDPYSSQALKEAWLFFTTKLPKKEKDSFIYRSWAESAQETHEIYKNLVLNSFNSNE